MDIAGENLVTNGSQVAADNVVIVIGEYTLTGGHVEGDVEKEIIFTGNPRLTYRGQTLTGDAIRFTPRTKAFSINNLHTALTPEFLRGRVQSPLYLAADNIYGQRNNPIYGEDIDATTCEKLEFPDYLIRAGQIKLEPGKQLTLRRATIFLFGRRIITLPTLVIPLDRRIHRFRMDHAPQVGRSQDEGFFVKAAFNYLLADRAPGVYRVDLMEKKGIGLGVEQGWFLLKSVGAIALYTIPTGGTNRNLSARINNRQDIGGGQTVTVDGDLQRNSYLALPATTNLNTRLGYTRNVEGVNTTLNIARQQTDTGASSFSGGSASRSISANLMQGFTFGRSGSISLNADYSGQSTSTLPFTSGGQTSDGFSQRTEQLATRFQADQRADNYTLQMTANKTFSLAQTSGQSFFSGVEKLPEVTLSSYRFTKGFLASLPALFSISAGKYSEGGFGTGTGTGSTGTVNTERVVTGFDINGQRFRLSPSTDLNISGGFQQFFYGNQNYAQYLLRNSTTLSQRWNKKSGLNLNYTYQRPEGATPFHFDQQGQFHALNGDIGFLDDRRLQLTARVGYDFTNRSFGGPPMPWQTLSANLLVRPVDWMRFRSLYSFDPNTGKFVSATADLRFRGHNDFALDLVGRYDPRQGKFGQINSYLNLPIGRLWRVIALMQYNGYLNRFESRNLQILREWDCLEASLTYIDNPYGFRNDKQIFFSLRIKAFPFFQRFGVGQFGQSIDTSIGDSY